MDLSVDERIAVRSRTVVLWRTGVTAAALSLVLWTTLLQRPGAAHFSTVPASGSGISHKGLLSLPAETLRPVLQTLGADDAAYRINASSGGLRAVNPAQGLRLRFGRSGVVLSSGMLRLGLSLRGVGFGSSIRRFDDLTPRAQANRLVYTRAGLSEWYVNGPLGLEQGFTIPRALRGQTVGPLTLSMALSGDAHASLAGGRESLTFSHPGAPSLRYGGLMASDARGRTLHSSLELGGGGVLLRVDTRGARYPLRIDPLIQQGSKLTGSGETEKSAFGFSVALSSDGDRPRFHRSSRQRASY